MPTDETNTSDDSPTETCDDRAVLKSPKARVDDVIRSLQNASSGSDHPSDLEMYLRLERMRLQEALCARDAVVARFSEACASIRQKTCAIERLQHDKDDLEKQVGLLKGRQAALVPVTGKNAPDKNRLAIEVGRLAEMFRTLQDQVDSMEQKGNGKEKHTGTVDGGENAHRETRYDWEVSLHRLLLFINDPGSYGVFRDASNDTPRLLSPNTATPRMLASPGTPHTNFVDLAFQNLTIEDTENTGHSTSLGASEPTERIQARNAILAGLPLPTDVPPDVLRPIVIPSPFTLHEFLGTTPASLRTQLGSYRVFQQSTTSWCPEREEHGYFLTPMFKCITNPRVNTAHRWTTVDISSKLNKSTECFYSKDSKWYYAGVYRAFWLDELSAREWDSLSTETSHSLIKETLTGRKNTSPQNVYETGQLYAAGALKVACIGLQCVGFNNALYRMLMEHAAKCTQTGRWRSSSSGGGHSPGVPWTPVMVPLSPNTAGVVPSGGRSDSMREDRLGQENQE